MLFLSRREDLSVLLFCPRCFRPERPEIPVRGHVRHMNTYKKDNDYVGELISRTRELLAEGEIDQQRQINTRLPVWRSTYEITRTSDKVSPTPRKVEEATKRRARRTFARTVEVSRPEMFSRSFRVAGKIGMYPDAIAVAKLI